MRGLSGRPGFAEAAPARVSWAWRRSGVPSIEVEQVPGRGEAFAGRASLPGTSASARVDEVAALGNVPVCTRPGEP
jgi:hypothetical protein